MTDAQKEAAKIIEAASQEVVNTLLHQGVENVDDKMEESKEKVQKEQEAQEEKKAQEEKAAEKKEQAQGGPAASGISSTDNSSADNTLPTSEQMNQLQMVDDLKRFAAKQNLLEEDIKGIVVDEQL
jgi:sRNA-binding protein